MIFVSPRKHCGQSSWMLSHLGKLQSQDYIKKVRRIMAYTQIEWGNIKELLYISTYSFNGNALDQSFVTMPQAPGNRGEYDILSCKSFFFSEVWNLNYRERTNGKILTNYSMLPKISPEVASSNVGPLFQTMTCSKWFHLWRTGSKLYHTARTATW